MLCPKCNSNNTYFDGIDNACRTCGKRWLRDGYQPRPVIINKETCHSCEGRNPERERTMKDKNRLRACRNCGRKMTIQSDDMCGGCNSAVYKKFEKGTPEYAAALAEAKKRFTDPNYKPGRKHPKKSVSELPTSEYKSARQQLLDAKIIGYTVIDDSFRKKLAVLRDYLRDKADKIDQAIELLS